MADNKKISSKEFNDQLKRRNAASEENIRLIEAEKNSLSSIFNMREKMVKNQEIMIERQNMINEQSKLKVEYEEKGFKIHGNTLNSLKKEEDALKKLNKRTKKRLILQKALLATIDTIGNTLIKQGGTMRKFFMDSDAAMKGVSLELGLSGERSAILRDNFMDSTGFAARMGVDMAGLAQMTSTYADETGRARLLSEENLKSITLMAKGTNLGIQGAAQLAGQYELIGSNATDTAQEIQRIVDTTERMGVNTSKVLKAVSKNFKALQKYTFRNGSEGVADMAIYAEKFKINMDQVLTSMEKGRSLDSVIEMSAQLQVLGGQFAKLADPMSMLFESRNDPEAYTKRINEMTKGMVTMNKTAKGFELQIASPMAQDQLAAAAKALGMTTEELTTQALKMREIQQTRSQMFGKGFTGKEKEMIEGLAEFDKKSGRMFVKIGGVATDVARLGTNDLKALNTQKETLEARAEASQTFDDALKNTIMELKSSLLPMLEGINAILKDIRPLFNTIGGFVSKISKENHAGLKIAGMAAATLMIAAPIIKGLVGGIKSLVSSGVKNATSRVVGGGVKNAADGMSGSQMLGKGKMMGAAGSGMMKGGAGIGMAAVGIGAGVGVAAVGISKLADSMSKLSKDQAEALQNIAMTLAITFPVAAAGMAIFATVGSAAVGPLLAIGAAMLMIGGGVGIAAAGIGYMAKGMSNLDKVDLSGIGSGILNLGIAALMMGNPLGLAGLYGMTKAVESIGSSSGDIERVGNAFYNIGAVLKGNASQFKEVRDIINDIASTDVSSNSGIAALTQMLSQPLKVEFSEKEVGFVANIDLSMGDSNFITQISKKIPARIVDLQQAKS